MSDTQLIISLRAEQQQLRKDLAKAKGQMQSFSKQTQTIAARIQTSLAVAFGGFAIVEGLRQTVGIMADFEFQMDKVAAISGASQEEVAELTKNARELGAVSKFTATEIAKLQEELARLGFNTGQIVNMTDAARKLATVADVELSQAAKVVGQQLKAFNLEASESARVANVIAESFSKSALDMEKFEVAMSFAGAAGKAFGQDIETTVSQVAVLIDRGIQASKAGTALRTILIELSKSGMTLEEALTTINESTNKLNTASELFGKTAANQALILAENQGQMTKLNSELSDGNEEMNKMVDIMEDNLITDFAKLKSAFQELILGGSGFAQVLRDIVRDLTEMVNVISGTEQKESLFETLEVFTRFGVMNPIFETMKDRIHANRLELQGLSEDTEKAGRSMWDNLLKQSFANQDEAKANIVDALFPNISNDPKAKQTFEEWKAIQDKMLGDRKLSLGVDPEEGNPLSDLFSAGEEAVNSFKNTSLDAFSSLADEFAEFGDESMVINEKMIEGWKKSQEAMKQLESVGISAVTQLAQGLAQGADANQLFANVLASTQSEVISMLIQRAVASASIKEASEKGVFGLLAAAAASTIILAAMNKIGKTKTSSFSGTSTNFSTGSNNTFSGTLRIETGAGGLWGIIEDEKNRQGLRGG